MSTPMTGRVAVVTGVGRPGQVGEAVAGAFASLGAHVVLLDRDATEVEARAVELRARGFAATAYVGDLTDPSSLDAVATSVAATHPDGVDALVCLAGGFAAGTVAETAPEAWHRQLAINLTTAFLTTHAFLPQVRRASGAIVYVASAAALPGARVGGMAAYAVAKAGVVTLMQAVAQEEREHGVRANALAPTAIRTASNVASMGTGTAYVEREVVAEWVTRLCGEASRDVTGQVVRLG